MWMPSGRMWMPSGQMPSGQFESMGEFIGHCHFLGNNIWILSSPLNLTQWPINSPMLSNWPLGIGHCQFGRTSFRHSRPATLCRGFREGDSVHRLQASLHSRGRPSAPCKADLYYRGAIKRHSEAHPMAFVGYVWMPSCQMPSCQIESMGEFIGNCHI